MTNLVLSRQRKQAHLSTAYLFVAQNLSLVGIAHLLEHMAFKGTERIGTRSYQQEAPILDALDEGATL